MINEVPARETVERTPAAGTNNSSNVLPHTLSLSVVIPAYNEQQRIAPTLERILDYLYHEFKCFEVIVADDGSTDETAAVVERYARLQPHHAAHPTVRVLRLPHRGKGCAVRAGMLAAQGDYILFLDADLSTPIEDVQKLLPWLEREYAVVIGSREGLGARRINEPFYRHLMGRAFNLGVRLITGQSFADTQCGFKAFHRAAAHNIFQRVVLYDDAASTVQGARVTGFDVEVLYVARKQGYMIREVPVVWQHMRGSKVSPVRDAFYMFRDIIAVRVNALRGLYDRDSSSLTE